MKPNGTMNNNSNLKMINEDEDKVERKLSTIVTASMAVQKLQNDQKKDPKRGYYDHAQGFTKS